MGRATVSRVAVVLVLMLAGAAVAGAVIQDTWAAPGEDLSQYLPPGAGKDPVVTACSECHELDRVVKLRKSKPQWLAILDQMKEEGAELSAAQTEIITTYLGEALGPAAPPLVDVNEANRDQIVKLPGVTPAMADRLIAQRSVTPFATRDQVRSALGLDEAGFAKIKWYVRAQPKTPARR